MIATKSSLPGVKGGWSVAEPGGHSEVWFFILQLQGLHCHFRGRISIWVLASKLRVLVHTRGLKCSCRALGSSSEFLAVLVRIPDSIWISKTASSGFEIWRGPTLAAVTLGFGKRAQRSLGMRWKRSVPFLEGSGSSQTAHSYFLWPMCRVDPREFAWKQGLWGTLKQEVRRLCEDLHPGSVRSHLPF